MRESETASKWGTLDFGCSHRLNRKSGRERVYIFRESSESTDAALPLVLEGEKVLDIERKKKVIRERNKKSC